uniref:Uncharacterized protein n=1 Tax=Globodera rostochiensis TaxID=31243 RepID=A0A914HRS6_GLORO
MTGDRFYPLGGLEFTNFRDEYDDFGEFTKWVEEWEGQAQVNAYEVRGGVGSVREGTGQSVDFEVEMGPTKLSAKCSENGKGHEFSGQIGPSGQISIKVKGKGTFKGCLTLLGIFWMAANMAQAMNQPRVKAGNVSSEEEFDFELQQWESELSGDLTNHPERVENMEEGQGPVERLENGTGNVPGQGAGAVPQGRGLIGSTTGQETTVRTCEPGIVARAVANQLSSATMGFRLDANWAEVHKSIPPPTILFPGPQGMRTAVVIPLEQQPSTSTAGIREDGPSSSGMGDEQHTGGERARWDGRTRHPQGRQNVRGEVAWPYERPERYGARLRPIRSRQHEQPREEATDVQTNPPRLRMPQGAPPLQIPAAMRRQFIRRLSQEREHAYGFALHIARRNPALSLALLSLEMFYSSLLAQALDEGDGGNFGAGECRR